MTQENLTTDQNEEEVQVSEGKKVPVKSSATEKPTKHEYKLLPDSYKAEEDAQKSRDAIEAQAAKYEADRTRGLAENDGRRNDPEDWNIGDHARDLAAGAVGGLVDTVSSLSTAGERAKDLIQGNVEFREDGELYDKRTDEIYDPVSDDWLPFDWGNEQNPLEAKGWGGQMVQMGTHFVSEGIVIVKTLGLAGGALGTVTVGTRALKAGKNVQTGVKAYQRLQNIKKLSKAQKLAVVNRNLPWYQRAVKFDKKEAFKDLFLVGAGQDVLSRHSTDHNMAGALKQMYPNAAGAIDALSLGGATNKGDSPQMMTLKNTMEGVALGSIAWLIAPLSIFAGRKGLKGMRGRAAQAALKSIESGGKGDFSEVIAIAEKTAAKTGSSGDKAFVQNLKDFDQIVESGNNANKSHWDQIMEMAEEQGNDPEWNGKRGGFKNKGAGVTDGHQGNPTHIVDTDTALRNKRLIDTDYEASTGSVGNPGYTAKALAENAKLERTSNDALIKQVLKGVKSSAWVKAQEASIRTGRKTLTEVFGPHIDAIQQLSRGKEAVNWDAKTFIRKLRESGTEWSTADSGKQIELAEKEMVAANLLSSSLANSIRDLGVGSRLIQDWFDLGEVDGPAQQLLEKWTALIGEVEKSKLLNTGNYGKQGSKFKEALDAKINESLTSLGLALDIAKESDNDDLFRNIFELISQSDDIHNITDFNEFIKRSLKGGTFKGKLNQAEWIKQSQAVMVHSILSGPKTPLRAIMGTGSAVFLRPMSTAIGASLPGTADMATRKAALSSMNAAVQAVPEAFQLFFRRLKAYWDGDLSTIKSRYKEVTQSDMDFEVYRNWIENSGEATAGERYAFTVANQMKALNDNSFLTYSTKIMAATDDAFGHLLGRMRSREKAVRAVLEQSGEDGLNKITPTALKQMEDKFMDQIFDINGNITDEALNFARKEVTLTQELTGFSKGLNDAFNSVPALKPFFLFARTGINGLNLTAKHTPIFNFLVEEFNDIMWATADDLSKVQKYGINNPTDLMNAKALATGRLAIGSSVIGLGTAYYAAGNLTGNGPIDEAKKQFWLKTGWKPRSLKVGNKWVSYDSFEPFTPILSMIGDIGDYSELMGESWTEDQFQKLSMVMAKGIASKTYLSGIGSLVDLLSGKPGQQNRILSNLMNNQLPMSGARNELGKLFNPYTKELGSGVMDALRNRNQFIPFNNLPIKYDVLTGEPIKDHNFITRAFNAISPVEINNDHSVGRQFLFNSGFDFSLGFYTAPDGTDLSDSPVLRSKFQKAMGDQNLEQQLVDIALRPDVQRSFRRYQRDLRRGIKSDNPELKYPHLKILNKTFTYAKKKAWQKIKSDSEAQRLIGLRIEKRRKDLQGRKEILNDLITY